MRANYSAYLDFLNRLSNFKRIMLSHLEKKTRAHIDFTFKDERNLSRLGLAWLAWFACWCVNWIAFNRFLLQFLTISYLDIRFPLSINRSISHGLLPFEIRFPFSLFCLAVLFLPFFAHSLQLTTIHFT